MEQCVHRQRVDTIQHATRAIGDWISFYNRRPHQALAMRTPAEAFTVTAQPEPIPLGRYNIFIERLWRSLKYECLYLHAWETGSQAKAGVGRWITFYNHQRPRAAHGGQPSAVLYFNAIETDQQVQAVAQVSRKSVQELGSSSDRLHPRDGYVFSKMLLSESYCHARDHHDQPRRPGADGLCDQRWRQIAPRGNHRNLHLPSARDLPPARLCRTRA